MAALFGKPPPEDRSRRDLAMDLLHAAGTGQFPFPGGLRDQPRKVQEWFRFVVDARAQAERLGRMLGVKRQSMGH